MPNLAAVKTAFIYGSLPINEKDDAAENYAGTKSRRILILSFSAPRVQRVAFQRDALRVRPTLTTSVANSAIFFPCLPEESLSRIQEHQS